MCRTMKLFSGVILAFALCLPVSATALAQNPEIKKMNAGQATVVALEDVSRKMPLNLFPDLGKIAAEAYSVEGVPSSISAFLIVMPGATALVDTGVGAPQGKMLQLLEAANVQPEQVTHVLLTHLHGDHVGGLALDGKAAFPNAQIVVGKVEKDWWLNPETLKKHPDRKGNIDLVRTNFALYEGKIKTVSFNEEAIPGIKALNGVGHTPGHTVFLLESDGAKVLFWGDLVHGAMLQFPNPEICASFDMDKPKAIESRKHYMALAAREKMPVAGAHLPFPSIVMVSKDGEGYAYEPVK